MVMKTKNVKILCVGKFTTEHNLLRSGYIVEPRLSVPRLTGFFHYPDFFPSPNFVMNIYQS